MNKNIFRFVVLLMFYTGCVSVEHKVQTEPAKVVLPPPNPAQSTANTATTAPAPAATAVAVETIAAAPHKTPEGVTPEQAMKWLKNGNRRFTKGFFRNDGATKKDILRLSSGQKPHSIILSCSDSRVPPEVVFDQKLGEVFVVRTAGEVLDSASIASIEYAVEHLGSRNILVMGHTQCGAVKAALATLEGQDAGSIHLNKLVADIHPRLSQFASKPASKNYADESWANTTGVAKDLLIRSPLIAEKVRSGDVQINTALYHLESGQAEFSK